MNKKMPWKHKTVIALCIMVSILITAAEGCNVDNPTTTDPGEDDRSQEELESDFEEGMVEVQMSGEELEEFCDEYPKRQQEIIDEHTDPLTRLTDRPYISLRKGVTAGLNSLFTENC